MACQAQGQSMGEPGRDLDGQSVEMPCPGTESLEEQRYNDLVLMRNLPLTGTCEEHSLPFVGAAHVGYLPDECGRTIGRGDLARALDAIADGPSTQQRATSAIADAFERILSPRGVVVVLETEHLCITCITMHGTVRRPAPKAITSVVRGVIRDDERTRAEVMALVTDGLWL